MHEEICEFPSQHFYENTLITDERAMSYWPDYPLEPYYLYNLIYTEHTWPSNGGSSSNKEERIFIKTFCIKLLEHLTGRQPYVKNDSEFIAMEKRIVLITPYKAQMTKFREKSLEFPRHIEVITVDSAQGKEKDIVLISCVRSGGTIGFLKDEHRLNVMLTRAKRALYIFGNLGQLAEQNIHWEALVNDATNRQVIDTVFNADQQPSLPFVS
jgi:superfamily I DNA and/or RNA helicase